MKRIRPPACHAGGRGFKHVCPANLKHTWAVASRRLILRQRESQNDPHNIPHKVRVSEVAKYAE
jgi:hypothetical protein